MTHSAHKRAQYTKQQANTTAGFTQSREEAVGILSELGVSPDVTVINKAGEVTFVKEVAEGIISLRSENRIEVLQKILEFTHNSIETTVDRSGTAPRQTSDIVSWKDHMAIARQHHPEINDEMIAYKGVQTGYMDVEEDILGKIEAELKRRIQEKNQSAGMPDEESLGLALRKLMMEDTKNDMLPKI